MLELLEEPKYLHLAQQELDQVVGRDRMVEESDLPNLPLLRAIVKESWRLGLSGLLLPRYAMEDTQVGGYDIPANTTVLVNVRGISRDPAAWPEPDRFYPERFLERSVRPLFCCIAGFYESFILSIARDPHDSLISALAKHHLTPQMNYFHCQTSCCCSEPAPLMPGTVIPAGRTSMPPEDSISNFWCLVRAAGRALVLTWEPSW